MSKLEKQIEYFSCKGKVIVCGDLNARVGNNIDLIQKEEDLYLPTPREDVYETILPRVTCDKSVVNQTGRWLIEKCVDNQLYILNGRTLGDLTGQFTCHTPRGSSTVDYFLASRTLSYFVHSMKVHDISVFSDHCMISVKLKLFHESCCGCENEPDVIDLQCCSYAPDRFIWTENARDRYREAFTSQGVQAKIKNLSDIAAETEDVDELINNISDVIVSVGDMALPRKSFKVKKKRPYKLNKKWYDIDFSMLKELKSAKNAFNRNKNNPFLRTNYYKKFKDYKRLTKYKRRTFRQNLTNMLNDAIEKDPNNAWKIINELKQDSVNTDKAEQINRREWFDHFYHLLNTDSKKIDDQRKENVNSELRNYETLNGTCSLDYKITEKEIFDACKKLKNNKASSYDIIRNEMLKHAVPYICKPITQAFNSILNSGKFPKSWRDGIIVPVHKNGSRLDVNNYRGITISSCLGKLFCHIVNERISKELEDKNYIKPEQAGFRKNHRTSDHIYVLKTIVDKYVSNSKNGSKLFACFIDLKKAFDTVWHEALFLKLQKAGICGKIYQVLKSMYSCCHSRVRCKNILSEPIEITKGVHQGNVLSPLLFNIFINDLGENLISDEVPELHYSKISHLLYADDLLLLSTSECGLQHNINKVNEFCNKWGLSINSDKSKIMIFSKNGQAKMDCYKFNVGQIRLECVKQYKYLGINISASGKFFIAEKNLSLKSSRALFSIKQSVFSNDNMMPAAILRIFDALVKPIALYNSDIWLGYKTCFQKKSIEEIFEISIKGQNDFDKVLMRFSKFVLGVHSKASNFAVISELGQYPLIISAIVGCINFWLHALQSSSSSLVNKAYLEQYGNSSSKSLWLNFVKNILNDLGFSHVWENQSTFNTSALLFSVKNKLKERFELFWETHMKSSEKLVKLRTYKLIKANFGQEKYLNVIKDRKHRKALAAFRISAHKLKIERGRYSN
ncbi:MAG: reverse transcriptase family protein [Candidatus Thiodiazotropha endolucinida]|nr:reverse transcriptase family protein [Candidatus Thiodiazotropha taylori]MCW4272514.1 reverse transcriptase family protein [Candidatus Thiodiazotropha endolucinida]